MQRGAVLEALTMVLLAPLTDCYSDLLSIYSGTLQFFFSLKKSHAWHTPWQFQRRKGMEEFKAVAIIKQSLHSALSKTQGLKKKVEE